MKGIISMKKILAVILSLALFASLAGCGAPAADSESTGTESQSTVTESTVESEEDKTAFDTSWAGGDYTMPVPQTPFKHSVSYSESQKMYTIINADTAEEISYDDIAAYCNILKDIGYTNVEKDVLTADEMQKELDKTGGAATAFIAKNGDGSRVVVSKEFSTWMVMVSMP